MKRMKKIASVMLALVMALVMAVPSFAAGTGQEATKKGSITIHNAAEGKTYQVYKVFDATYAENNTVGAYTYEPSDEHKTLWTNNSVLATYFDWNQTTGVITPKNADTIDGIFQITNDRTKETINELKRALKQIATLEKDNISLGTDEKDIKVEDLSYGYYLVWDTADEDGSGIAIDNVNQDADMYDKNVSYPTWKDDGKKIVTGEGSEATIASYNIGDTVTFRLHINTQNYALENPADPNSDYKQIKEYVIGDNLAGGKFSLKSGTINVNVKENNGTNVNPAPTFQTTDGGFPITIKWAEEAVDGTRQSLYKAGAEMVIEYQAVLQDDAVIGDEGNTNTASLGWKVFGKENEDPDHPSTNEETKEATVYTYAFAIDKCDKEDNNKKLQGAVFEIHNTSGEKINVKSTNEVGVYVYDKNGTAIITSPVNGLITIKGIAEGEYKITEITAPDGYNRLSTAIDVKAEKNSSITKKFVVRTETDADGKTTTTTEIIDNDQSTEGTSWSVISYKVENNKGSLLPSTGGIGTTIFYIVGAILVVGAAVLLVTKKRMSKEV